MYVYIYMYIHVYTRGSVYTYKRKHRHLPPKGSIASSFVGLGWVTYGAEIKGLHTIRHHSGPFRMIIQSFLDFMKKQEEEED